MLHIINNIGITENIYNIKSIDIFNIYSSIDYSKIINTINMPRISVFCSKGSTGKTPIAMNIVYDRDYNVATNEPYNVIEDLVPDNKMMVVGLNEEFPELPKEIDIVFDLAGAISEDARSITSAIKQSDLVIVPINNEFKAIKAGLHSIAEVRRYNSNILVVGTKLTKQKTDIFTKDWTESRDFQFIKQAVSVIDKDIPVLPLKMSTAFDTIFESEKSIGQICKDDPLLRHSFKLVEEQFQAIYSYIDKAA